MEKNLKVFAKFFYVLTTFLVSSTSSAFANMPDAGEETGPGMTALETILWFVVAPAGIWIVTWFLWSIPKWRKTNTPKTGDDWNPKPTSDVVQN